MYFFVRSNICIGWVDGRPCALSDTTAALESSTQADTPAYTYSPTQTKQTGGTLYECGVALKALGASSVSVFVAHAVFPNESWKR